MTEQLSSKLLLRWFFKHQLVDSRLFAKCTDRQTDRQTAKLCER